MSDIQPSAVPQQQRDGPKKTWDDKVDNKSSQEPVDQDVMEAKEKGDLGWSSDQAWYCEGTSRAHSVGC